MTTSAIAHPKIVSRDEWLVARKELLSREKELTRRRDALNAEHRRLPMLRIDKEYVFEGPGGKAGLLDLFEGRRQLIIYHFMFHRGRGEGCSFMAQHAPPRTSVRARQIPGSCVPHHWRRSSRLRRAWAGPCRGRHVQDRVVRHHDRYGD
ncbi:MAG: DUF899 family protein [Chromatiales bacterium]